MANETIHKLFTFAEELAQSPKWINPKIQDTFKISMELSDESSIEIRVSQQGERISYQVPFTNLPPSDTQRQATFLKRLLSVNSDAVTIALIGDALYLKTSHPVTYDDTLDRQLFVQTRSDIARFYEDNRETLLAEEG